MENDSRDALKELLGTGDPRFWAALAEATRVAAELTDMLALSTLRRRALKRGLLPPSEPTRLRLALLGGVSLFPLREVVDHLLAMVSVDVQLWAGDFDNYIAEISEDPGGRLEAFAPDVLAILPTESRCRFSGPLWAPRDEVAEQAGSQVEQLLSLCEKAHTRTGAEIILANFRPPADFDPGPLRLKSPGSDWNFRRTVNLELGLRAPAHVHVCDAELLASRRGLLASRDSRAWFESKQPGSAGFVLDLAREIAHLANGLRKASRKVLVLDLDNTLWGGVIGDDGVEGIELGDTSPRGEAFKAFQRYVLGLSQRGVLLAVCSKNDMARALEPFELHTEMVLQRHHIVAFEANWDPKPDNLRRIAASLGLGLDSLVFVDDNPAEVDIVRVHLPEVAAVRLGPDPADYVEQLQAGRHFAHRALTEEDVARTQAYRADTERRQALAVATDLDSYLASLEMVATVRDLSPVDVPRVAQLINKSNQFNLTTRRRTEAEVAALANSSRHACLSLRLADRFGDHGLVAVVILEQLDPQVLEVDTWLMSCRVLNRQVEDVTANAIAAEARRRGCTELRGVYRPSARNEMVRDLYDRLGFHHVSEAPDGTRTYSCAVLTRPETATRIRVETR